MAMAAVTALVGITLSAGCGCLLDVLNAAPDGLAGGGAAALGGDMTLMVKRVSAEREARVVYYAPGPHGGVFGPAIQLYTDGELEFEAFQRFLDAVLLGNAYFWGDRAPTVVTNVYADEEAEAIADPNSLGQDAAGEYTNGGARCEVVANQPPVLYGYHIDIYVDDSYVISIYKACNECDLLSLAQAEDLASTCVFLLQGWTR